MVSYKAQGDISVGQNVHNEVGGGGVANVGVDQVIRIRVKVGLDSFPSFKYLGPEGIAQSQAQGLRVLCEKGHRCRGFVSQQNFCPEFRRSVKSFKPGALQGGPEGFQVRDSQTTKPFGGEDYAFGELGSFAVDESGEDLQISVMMSLCGSGRAVARLLRLK